MTKTDLKFSKEHEWVSVSGDTATIGISDYAQSELGDIVYLELPEVEAVLETGQECGVVESVKTVSDIFSPLSGEVIEINDAAIDSPEILNKDPYDKGWLIKLKMSDKSELDSLMDKAEYNKYIEE